jgi:hypothetical protein
LVVAQFLLGKFASEDLFAKKNAPNISASQCQTSLHRSVRTYRTGKEEQHNTTQENKSINLCSMNKSYKPSLLFRDHRQEHV